MLYSVPTNGLQAVHLARRYGIPVVFRSIDILYKLVRQPWLRPVTRYLEKKVYASVDEILAITPNHARYVTSLGASPDRVKTLLLPVDTGIFHPDVASADIRRQWQLADDQPVILFIGTLFHFSALDRFISASGPLFADFPEAKLLIVGDGPQRPRLEIIISKHGLQNNVIITGFQPYDTMPRYISLATVCINTFLDTDETHDIFPGKIIQYLAGARPTVATPLLGITTLVPNESRGIIYCPTPEAMTGAVAELLKIPEKRQQLGRAGYSYVKLFHDQYHVARQADEMLKGIVERHKTGGGV